MADPVTAWAQRHADDERACRWFRLAARRHLEDLAVGEGRGLRFDVEAALQAIRFCELLPQSKGEWAGRPLLLQPWQRFVVGSLFGWQRLHRGCAGCGSWIAAGASCPLCGVEPRGEERWYRRFRFAYLEVPRKNGKTTLAAAIALKLAFADGEPGAEVYSAATKRDQARICWEEARRMVLLSSLRHHVRAVRANLSAEALAQKFEPLGADSDRMDGLNVHGAVIDELHAHPDAGVLAVIETATGSRRQPLILAITTAGYDRESVCYQRHEYAEQVLSGTIDDDRWFALIATLDDGDDWRDPALWGKANPNLGVSVSADSLQADVERALRIPAEQPVVLQKRFNVWVQAAERAIDLDLWDANGRLCEDWAGRPVFAGLDLGAYDDLTAWVLVSPHPDGSAVDVRARFWVPEARLYASDNRYREQYQAWARAGFLEVTPGRGQDYAAVRRGVLEDCARYPVVEIAVDRLFQAHQLATELAGELGEERIVGVGQGFLSLAAPCREMMGLLLAGGLHHGGHPVLRWMASGLAFRRDPAGNLKPDKASSQVKIDGIVALLMALDRSSRHRDERVLLRAV